MRRLVLLFALMLAAALVASGAAFAVTKNCNGGICRGTDDNDTLRGSDRLDILRGLGGDDRLVGLGATDRLKGSTGSDVLDGGGGDDRLKGGVGRDRLLGGAGSDVLRAATKPRASDGVRDFLYCGPGTDTVYFVPGQDFVADNCEIRNPPAQPPVP